MFRRLRGINFIIIVLLALGLAGCGDDTTTSTDTGDTISNDSSIAFTGKVVDPLGNPLSGVSIELISDTKQTDTTDANGNWLINVDLGEIKATRGGGSDGGNAAEDLQDNPDQLLRNYPIEISKTGFPTYRYEAAFNATIGYTDGSGAVVLLSKTGNVQPTTILHPYVDNFEFTVYAGLDTAPGAVVTLRAVGDAAGDLGANAGSVSGNRYEIDTKMFKADEEGVIKVTKDDKLPANRNYTVFAAPYDSDGDGVYEYDSSVATQPAGGFNLNVANVAGALIHYELDADGNSVITQTEFAPSVLLTDARSDIVVTYLNIQNVNNIPVEQAETFEIVVMFNRPVIEQDLAAIGGPLFTLTGRGGVTIPFSVENTAGNYLYTLTPDSTLTTVNNQYTFTVLTANLLGSSGGFSAGANLVQNFYIYDPDATMYAAIPPGLDIEANRSFKVDWNDVLLGDPSETNPYAKANMIPNVRISWPACDADEDGVEDATGYEAWVKDSDTPWQNVTANFNIDYNDGQFYEAIIDLTLGVPGGGGLFDSFDVGDSFGLDATEPFFAQTLQIVIMPQNANGFATDPNSDTTIAGLSLKDNWGPEVVAGLGWDGATATDFTAATRYDDTVQIAFDEPLKDATLTADYAAGGYGATVSSGYFQVGNNDAAVDPVRWPDLDLIDPLTDEPYASKRTHILVDLQPTVTTTLTAAAADDEDVIQVTAADMGNFAIGDALVVNDNDEGTIEAFDYTAATFYLSADLSEDAASGSEVYWRGPIQAGYESVTGPPLATATDANDLRIYVNSLTGIDAGESFVEVPAGCGNVIAAAVAGDVNRVRVTTAPTDPFDPGDTVSGYCWGATAAAIDTCMIQQGCVVVTGGGATVNLDRITVGTTAGLHATDDSVRFLDAAGDPVTRTATLIDATHFDVATLGAIYVAVLVEEIQLFSTTLDIGYPVILLPGGGADGIKPYSTITFSDDDETDSATVLGAFRGLAGVGTGVVINKILADTFAAGDDYTVDSARVPGALQINVLDRAGIATSATDTDGDGTADRDQIGYEEVGDPFGIF